MVLPLLHHNKITTDYDMDNAYLLRRVLPSVEFGTYVANTQYTKPGTTDKIVFNTSFNTLEALQEFSETSSKRGCTAYYALGTFAGNMVEGPDGKVRCKRKASMAQAFKTFAIDIDCGPNKDYPEQRDGARALVEFLSLTELPPPIVVSSGYGLHCYWPLTEAIDRDTWVAASTSLRELTILKGLKIDESKVCDPAMVLRPLGTTNWKGEGVVVRMLRDAEDNAPAAIMLKIGVNQSAPKPLPASAFAEVDALMAATAGMGENPPADAQAIANRCQQVRALTFGHGVNASEPQWQAVLGIAKYCENPEEVAVDWSRGHPGYDLVATLAKMEHWGETCTGAAHCTTFEERNPGGCANCRYIGKIKSPIALGYPQPEALPTAQDLPPVTELTPDTPIVRAPATPTPEKFVRSTAGVYREVEAGVFTQLCAYDMFPVMIIYDAALGFEEAVWAWNKPHCGYVEMKVRLSQIFNDGVDALITTLSNNGCMVATKLNQAGIAMYMRAYMQSLQQAQAHKDLHGTMGWKEDGSFVLGTTEIKSVANKVTMTEIGVSKAMLDKRMDKAFALKGNTEVWVGWTKLFQHPELRIHGFTLGAAFAAPLVSLTALDGYCISLVGESGSGKSTMQRLINSVYGDPKRLEMKKSDTQLAIVTRMGQVAHLPVTIDECTQMDPLLLVDFAYWATQGCDKHRQTDTAEMNHWALPVILSSNKSLRDKLIVAQPDDTAASMRLMEFTFPHNTVFDGEYDVGRKLAYMVQENHGGVGRKYLEYIVGIGLDTLKQRWHKHLASFDAKYGCKFSGAERYWQMNMVLHDFGLQLATEAGLIKYAYAPCTQAALEQLNLQRTIVHDAQLNPYDMIATYVNSNLHAVVTVTYNHDGKGTANVDQPLRECFIRRELYKDKAGIIRRGYLYFDRSAFRRWLHTNKWDYKKIYDVLHADGALHVPNKYDKISMGKDTPMRLGQVPIVGLKLTHSALHHMLHDGLDDDIELGAVVAFTKER